LISGFFRKISCHEQYFLALLSIECHECYLWIAAAIRAGSRKTSMKFRSLHDRVVIRRAEGDVTSKGGIIIPDVAKEKPQEGEVVAIGPGRRDQSGNLVPLDVKVGD
jgi:chaperonin GroES